MPGGFSGVIVGAGSDEFFQPRSRWAMSMTSPCSTRLSSSVLAPICRLLSA
jgi:hypothetical protein